MVERLPQKESAMLRDQLRHEEVCIRKYTGYAARTADADLRGMFYEFAQDEQDHYNTINGLLGGTQPGAGATGGATPGQNQSQSFGQSQGQGQGLGQGQAPSQGPNLNKPWQSPTVRQPMSTEEFIEKAAEERLQSGVFGHHKSKSRSAQEEPQSTYATGQEQTGQEAQSRQDESQQGQPTQATRSTQATQPTQSQGQSTQYQARQTQSHWPLTGQPQQSVRQSNQQSGGQAGQPGETSSELIPMFNTEASEEIAGGTGLGENDSTILNDMLMTEQFVSDAYDAAIFDTANQQVRQALQHIQQDEQKHGQGIRDYMQRRGLGRGQT